MLWLEDFYAGLARLFGGSPSVWLIFLLAIAMWALVVERYWYFFLAHEDAASALQSRWRRWATTPRLARRARRRLIRAAEADLHRAVDLIRHFIAVIFLLGLLGSVTGIMQVLNALSLDSGGIHALARGIVAASLPAVVALAVVATGVYFGHALAERAATETQLLRDQLRR